MRLRDVTSLFLTLGATTHCSSDPPRVTDAGARPDVTDAMSVADAPATDASADDAAACPALPALETGGATGAADPLRATEGSVRAGVIVPSAVPPGSNGLAEWRAGDFVLANGRVAVIIEGMRNSSGYMPWGGFPLGAGRVSNGAMVAPADFGEVAFTLGRYSVAAERVGVLRDGADGVAVVRAVGPMRAIPFIDEFARVIAPQDYGAIRAAVDYELRPNSDHVDVFVTFEVNEPQGYTVRTVLHAFFQGYRMPRFIPGAGFGGDAAMSQTLGWVRDDLTSWAWQLPRAEDRLASFISTSGFDSFNAPAVTLPPCAQTRLHWARIVVGGPGLDGLNEALARGASQRTREITGTVRAGSEPVADARVHVTSPDGARYLTRVRTDAMGRFTAHVPEGAPARFTAWRPGFPAGTAVTVDATTATAAPTLPAPARISVRATEDGAPVPARVQVFAVGDTAVPTAPGAWGEVNLDRGRVITEYPTDGRLDAPLPPGRWRVVVSRGPHYEITDQTVTAVAGETVTVNAALRRVIPRDGVLCGDFHIHTHRSADSGDDARVKLAAGAADGLEVMARSEHEYVSDFEDLIADMGIGRYVRGVGSIELTTFTWGHFGVFPLTADPAQPNGGAFAWANRSPPEVFADVRRRAESPTLVINHPRGDRVSGAYFDAAGWDRTRRVAARPMMWDDRFNAVEIFNDSAFGERPDLVADWFSFLAMGRRVFAVGSSDSHSLVGSPVGYPRTCMALGTDDPRMATPQAIGRAVGEGRSTIEGGVSLRVTAVGASATAGPGQTLMGTGERATLRVVVRAPTWVRPRDLVVYVDGTALPATVLGDAQRDPMDNTVRFRGDIPVSVAPAGSWAIVVINGEELTPVYPGRQAFAASNPIFLQR
jgi:hypothetical protein